MEGNRITINKKVVEKVKIIEVTGDIIVPDIKPDIINIINTNGNAYVYKEEISQGRIRVDGNIDTYVVYLSDNGETRSMQTTMSFIESIEDPNIKEGMWLKQKVTIESIDTKVLNERKISIKASLRIKAEFFENSEIQILDEIGEMNGVEKLKETVTIKSIVGMNRTRVSIREDIAVDNTLEVAELLKTDIEVKNIENKISYNKVLTKADANVKIIFITEDERIQTVEATIPIMSFIDIDKITEEHVCQSDYIIRNMLFKANSKEMHSINCQVDFEVCCEAYESKDIEVIQDMYGIRENVIFSKKEVEVQIGGSSKTEIIRLNENVMIEDVHTILDVDCNPTILNAKQTGNFISYEGELKLEFYYEADNRNGLNVKSTKIPFIVKLEGSEKNIELSVSRKLFSLNNENVECDIELVVKQNSMTSKTINMIDNVESKPYEEENDYKMFIYFVKAEDTVWKIAKRFKVCMEDIIKLNNLEEPNKLNIGDRLYIMR